MKDQRRCAPKGVRITPESVSGFTGICKIRQKLIEYSNKEEQVHKDMSFREAERLLIKSEDGKLLAFDLIDEIGRTTTAERLKKKV